MISKGNATDLLYVSISYPSGLSHAHETFIKISYDRPEENIHVITENLQMTFLTSCQEKSVNKNSITQRFSF